MTDSKSFSAPWSTSLKITTALVVVFLIGVAGFGVATFGTIPQYASIAMIALPAIILFGTSFFVIRGFELTPGELRIRRLFWDTRIPLTDLSSAEADPHAIDGSIRLFGIGGLFCYAGLFRNAKFGNYRLYATNFVNPVVLKFPNRTVVLTPGDPEGFVKALGK